MDEELPPLTTSRDFESSIDASIDASLQASAQPDPLRVLIVSPYHTVRAGLRAMLHERDGLLVVGEAASLPDDAEVDLSAIDAIVAQVDGEEAIAGVEEASAHVPLVLLARRPESLARTFEGAEAPRGYLIESASADELAAAVTAVAQGLVVLHPAVAHLRTRQRSPLPMGLSEPAAALTAREQEVLALVASGLPNKGVALQLGISEHTVKFHVGAILGKLGAASRTEAVTMAVRSGMLPL